MPAKSKSQQALMAMVYSYLNGETTDVSDQVKEIAKSMSKEEARKYASTKTKNLPSHVKESIISKQMSFSQFIKESGTHDIFE